MSVDVEEIFPLLLANNLEAVVLIGDRVFPNRIPQRDVLPAVIVRRIAGGPIHTSNGRSDVRRASFQVECWSEVSQEQARAINRAIQAIETKSERIGDWWVQSLFINPETDQDNPQIPIHADDLGLFCAFTEFNVFFKPGS